MRPLTYVRAAGVEDAISSVRRQREAKLLAGGTNLVDPMKMGVEQPGHLIDITRLLPSTIEEYRQGASDRSNRGQPYVESQSDAKPGDERNQFSMYSIGAQFAEVRVDADLGQVRVSCMVCCFAAGRILNAKTARGQFMGGMIWGISFALLEHTTYDDRLGRIVNNNLAEYHVPTNADVGSIEALWADQADDHIDPVGVKGIGEIGITGSAAAIANAVYHAAGKRVRDLPITPDKLR